MKKYKVFSDMIPPEIVTAETYIDALYKVGKKYPPEYREELEAEEIEKI